MKWNAVLFLAYKDIVRQRRLLVIVVLALTLGITNTVMTVGLMKGFEQYISGDIVETIAGHILITPKEGQDYFSDPLSIIDKAEAMDKVKSVSPRTYITAKIRKAVGYGHETSVKVQMGGASAQQIIAMDPERETVSSMIESKVTKGDYLTGEHGQIMLGRSMADDIVGVDVGDKVEVSFPNGKKEVMDVIGFVETGEQGMDMMYAYMNSNDADRILGGRNKYNTILVKLYDQNDADFVKRELLQSGVDAKITTWEEAMEFVRTILDMMSMILFFISGIAIIAASSSIAIMVYINILNRTRQIGTLKAMGASPNFVMLTFVSEAALTGVVGVAVGLSISFALITYLTLYPISVGKGEYLKFAMDLGVSLAVCIVTLTCVFFASIYPAYRASKLEVVEALRYE